MCLCVCGCMCVYVSDIPPDKTFLIFTKVFIFFISPQERYVIGVRL